MTAKEKAIELYDKYKGLAWGNTAYTRKHRQKQCALIAVDEVLDVIIESDDHTWETFWRQVKAELEKL